MAPKHIFVAMTGASGSMYGLRLAEQLCLSGVQVTFSASCSGTLVCREETGLDLSGDLDKALQRLYDHLEIDSGIRLVHPDDLFCGAASGSSAPDALVVCPCSMGTLARIAGGHLRQPDRAERRRHAQGAPPAAAGPQGNAALRHPPGEHAEALPRRSTDRPGDARLLRQAGIGAGPGRLRRGEDHWTSWGSRTTSTSGGARNNLNTDKPFHCEERAMRTSEI